MDCPSVHQGRAVGYRIFGIDRTRMHVDLRVGKPAKAGGGWLGRAWDKKGCVFVAIIFVIVLRRFARVVLARLASLFPLAMLSFALTDNVIVLLFLEHVDLRVGK
ncbi:hypothetical protein BCR44DRAFT_45030 [Catenaria anguillulae PL171]|uniref:Uncharacterized protein n=1 Tax=Catenaria anguillulae PL171 TaxID=765915 RepID=A0A1Y2H5P2_9FUNG|nr:hypothetical protein BCR44DRAFT_45030 [Catenaria anguillulae PL171]